MNYLIILAKINFIIIAFFNLQTFCQVSKGADSVNSGKVIDISLGGFVYATAFSSDGNDFAAGGFNKVVKVWDTKTWRLKYELKHPEIVTNIAFAPSQKVLATVNNELGNGGSSNVRISFWDVETGEIISTYKQDNSSHDITSIAFSPNGKVMAVGLGDGFVKILSVEAPKDIKVINEKITKLDSGISSLQFSPNSQFLAVGAGKGISGPKDFGTVKIMDVETGREVFKETTLTIIHNVAFSPDGKVLAVAGNKKEMRESNLTLLLFDITTWKLIEEKNDYPIGKGLEFSPNGKLLVSASPDELESKVVVLDIKTKRPLLTFKSNKPITSLTLSPTGTLIAVGDEVGNIRLYPISKKPKS